jgi:hypothetical protein
VCACWTHGSLAPIADNPSGLTFPAAHHTAAGGCGPTALGWRCPLSRLAAAAAGLLPHQASRHMAAGSARQLASAAVELHRCCLRLLQLRLRPARLHATAAHGYLQANDGTQHHVSGPPANDRGCRGTLTGARRSLALPALPRVPTPAGVRHLQTRRGRARCRAAQSRSL